MINNNEVLEFAKYGKNFYGTPKAPIDKWLSEGKTIILKIEVQGAQKIKELYSDAVGIFIMPPSIEELEKIKAKYGAPLFEICRILKSSKINYSLTNAVRPTK